MDRNRKVAVLLAGLLAVALLVASSIQMPGSEDAPEKEEASPPSTPARPPPWPELSQEQHAVAKRLGVPVRFANGLGMRFVLIPSGRYVISNAYAAPTDVAEALAVRKRTDAAEAEGADFELTWDLLPVEIEEAFYVQITEVTNHHFRQLHPDWHTWQADGPNQPVNGVGYSQAEAFAVWLSDQDGQRSYRLPTDREWEVACRAGTRTRYWWGDNPALMARYAQVGGRQAKQYGPADVGTHAPSPWGLYDLFGNVYEWCAWTPGSYAVEKKWGPGHPPSYEGAEIYYPVLGGDRASEAKDLGAGEIGLQNGQAERGGGAGFRLVSPLPAREE